MFPNASFKPKVSPCKFGLFCKRMDCTGAHPSPCAMNAGPLSFAVIMCGFDLRCNNPNCWSGHSSSANLRPSVPAFVPRHHVPAFVPKAPVVVAPAPKAPVVVAPAAAPKASVVAEIPSPAAESTEQKKKSRRGGKKKKAAQVEISAPVPIAPVVVEVPPPTEQKKKSRRGGKNKKALPPASSKSDDFDFENTIIDDFRKYCETDPFGAPYEDLIEMFVEDTDGLTVEDRKYFREILTIHLEEGEFC